MSMNSSQQRSVMKRMLAETVPEQSKLAVPTAVSTAVAKRSAQSGPS
jgi:hypothetical protein